MLYRRNVSGRLWFLRTIFLCLVFGLVYCANNKLSNGIYFLSVVLLFGSLLTATTIAIQSKLIEVTRFYFFGFLPFTHDLSEKKIELFSIYGRNELAANSETLLGCLFVFFPVQAKFQGMIVSNEKKEKEKRIPLNDEEYKIIHNIIQQYSLDINKAN